MTDAERIVQEQIVAYNAKNIDRFSSFYDESIEIFDLPVANASLSGKADFIDLYSSLFELNPDLHCEVKKRITLGDFVIDEEWITGLRRHPNGLPACAIYQVQNGLIIRVWFVPR